MKLGRIFHNLRRISLVVLTGATVALFVVYAGLISIDGCARWCLFSPLLIRRLWFGWLGASSIYLIAFLLSVRRAVHVLGGAARLVSLVAAAFALSFVVDAAGLNVSEVDLELQDGRHFVVAGRILPGDDSGVHTLWQVRGLLWKRSADLATSEGAAPNPTAVLLPEQAKLLFARDHLWSDCLHTRADLHPCFGPDQHFFPSEEYSKEIELLTGRSPP
jgi:hypothetical protein